MVMFSRSAAAISVAALFGFSSALSITQPSKDLWWVAKSSNTLTWDCKNSPANTFTVLIANTDPKILTQPQAIISVQQNADCSKEITTQQADQPPATGYTILLANTLNSTDVYATSDQFEIKPLGSLYPSQVSASASAASASAAQAAASAAASSPSPTKPNGALSMIITSDLGFVVMGAVAAVMAF